MNGYSMRLGSVETGILALLIPNGGEMDVGSIKYELSGFRSLRGEMGSGLLRSIRSLHVGVAQSLRSLERKELVRREDHRIHLLWENVAVELIHRTHVGRRMLAD